MSRLLLFVLCAVVATCVYADPPQNNQGFCNSINQQEKDQMLNCAKAYWQSQVFPRSSALDNYVLNCFNENVVSAPFSTVVAVGKAAVAAGWSEVSTVIPGFGPFFENNTKVEFFEIFWGCNETINAPYVTINLKRTLRFWFTGESVDTPYTSTFTFIKSSNQHQDPSQGAPDWTILHLRYHPFATAIIRLWPGLPIQSDIYGQLYACNFIKMICPSASWAPYDNCYQWMNNHPITVSAYGPGFYTGAQDCVYQVAFYSIAETPGPGLCPALGLCTGNFQTKRGTPVSEDQRSTINALVGSGSVGAVMRYLYSLQN